MKKLIVSIAFAAFSLGFPLVIAQAAAQETDSSIEINTTESEPSSSVDVEIQGLDADQEDRVREAVEGLGKVFGDQVKAEIEVELRDLSDEERRKLGHKLDNMFGGDHISFDTGGLGFAEAIVAITAICLTLGLPVIILLVVFIFAQKKRRQMMELAGLYVKADQPVPPHVMSEFGTGMSAAKRLRTGLQFVLVGIALLAILGTIGDEAAVFALIPIAIGLARIIYWRYESKNLPVEEPPAEL